MLQDKSALIESIKKISDKNVANKRFILSVVDQAYERYLMPKEITYDVITSNKNMDEMDNFELFVLLDCLAPGYIPEFFTDAEQQSYKNMKIESEETFELPFVLNMVQISNDQWIGKITVKDLMLLRNSRKIRYNENTQRTLKRIVKDGEESYRISLNAKAVEAIKQSYLNGTYIANTITLNMPETTEYTYNKKTNQLTIKSLDYFDILDGYHRYIAMAKIYDRNQDFDYEMELRLVMFGEERARQFIWQEDQKTKMKKIESESMNQTNSGVQVVNELNQSLPFVGKINNNEGIINAAVMAKAISVCYFDNKNVDRKTIIETKKDIVSKVRILEDENPSLFDTKWDNCYTMAFILSSSKTKEENLCSETDRIFNKLVNSSVFNGEHSNIKMIERLKKQW